MTPLVLLFALAFLVSVDIRILAPVLPSISASLGSPPGIVGLAMTTYSLAFELISLVLLVAILGALVIARYGRTRP